MLMEPDEYTSQERALTDKAKELIEQHELDWGNGECFIQRDAGHSELYMTLEAPNHATVTVTVPAEADEKGLRRAMADGLLDFDPDEEFDECWSREFAARNGFTPSGFLSGLQEDKAYFGLRSEALLHPGQSNAGQGNETIAEIRWTEEDLRHWLKDHDWPDNNENMDAMRDMISARELRDRSIEEGWEIIDAKTGSPAAFDLASLVQPGERIADYTISGTGTNWGAPSYQCIVEEGSTDIHAALEDTMHRIIDARAATGDAVDVLRETMGAMPAASVGEDDGVSPIDLDLGYVLPGAVTSFAERAQACDPSDPLNMTDTAGSGLSK